MVYIIHFMKTLFIWIDEAWRGSWAGPLVVSAIATYDNNFFEMMEGLTDSKKMTKISRENIFQIAKIAENSWKIVTHTEIIESQIIDEIGIKKANCIAMERCILQLLQQFSTKNIEVYIDGADNFYFWNISENPKYNVIYDFAKKKNAKIKKVTTNIWKGEMLMQNSSFQCEKNVKITFMIAGDNNLAIISLASVFAKVQRDAIMMGFSKDFPEYFFDTNMGYWTQKHRDAILNYGIKKIHRKSYQPMKALISQKSWLL